MSVDRPRTPFQQPYTVSIQAGVKQGATWQQIAGNEGALSPPGDDAEACYKRASALRESRRFDEALAAFNWAIALKPGYAEAHNGRGIVLANLQRSSEALASFDTALSLKPDYVEAYNNSALVLQDLSHLDEALARFDKAIAYKQDDARVHRNRGAVLQDLKRLADAVDSYDRAIALKPDYADAFNNRGIVQQELGRLGDALASFGKAIGLKADYAEAYNNRGIVLQDLHRFDEALADFDKAIALQPNFAEAFSNKSYCLLKTGRLEQGWRLHEWRKNVPKAAGARALAQPLWLGREDISNATVFVHWEQGLGDTIQFCRYGKLLGQRGATVVMSVQEPLFPLLKQMSPAIRIIKGGELPSRFDYHCPLMSLPLAFGTTLPTIPAEQRYISSDEALRKTWDARLPPRTKKRIGFVWRGNPTHRNDRNRSIDLGSLAPLFGTDAHWVSLQRDLAPADIAALAALPQITGLGDELQDFSGTAAVIDGLDLVIAVDTSVAHLAGAMGKAVWILLPFNADWRWLTNRDDSPWYPSARLFRQAEIGGWANVIAQVQAALLDFVGP